MDTRECTKQIVEYYQTHHELIWDTGPTMWADFGGYSHKYCDNHQWNFVFTDGYQTPFPLA